MGSDGIRTKNGKRLTLKWDSDIQGGFTEMAELIQAQLRGIGIDVPVTKIAESVWIQEYFKGQMNFGEITWWFPDASLLRTMFGSKSVWNGSHWKNSEMEALLDKTDATIDSAERLKLIKMMQQLVMKEGVMLPLAVNPTIHVLNKAVQNYDVTYLGFPLFYDVSLS
jgi:peptide/nickel transport system substrate-binding protein